MATIPSIPTIKNMEATNENDENIPRTINNRSMCAFCSIRVIKGLSRLLDKYGSSLFFTLLTMFRITEVILLICDFKSEKKELNDQLTFFDECLNSLFGRIFIV